MSVTTIKFLDHFNEETERYEEVDLPAKFQVCGDCSGMGGSSAYLGAFTRDEMDEMGEEFLEDYRAGNFDRPCETCQGQRVVAVVDEDECDPALLEEFKAMKMAEWESRMSQLAEMRVGA